MSHYKSNLRDIEFNLFEVLGTDQVLGTGPFDEIDVDTAREILAEVDRLAREDLAASFEESDRTPPVFDPEAHTAACPRGVQEELPRLDGRRVLAAGHARRARRYSRPPRRSSWAVGEMVLGANPRGLDVRRRPELRGA